MTSFFGSDLISLWSPEQNRYHNVYNRIQQNSSVNRQLLQDCRFLFMLNKTCYCYFPVFREESETFQHSKISNITHQAAEYLNWVIFCNNESYKHCVNITIPLREIDCLSFQASSHSLPCHKYLLSLVHSSAFTTAFEYFLRLPGLHQCFHSSGLITGDLSQLCHESQRKAQLIRNQDTEWYGIKHDFKGNKWHFDCIMIMLMTVRSTPIQAPVIEHTLRNPLAWDPW